ncbi:MAG: hypothetical protein AAGH88_03095 [Planctomycetota bacterium]
MPVHSDDANLSDAAPVPRPQHIDLSHLIRLTDDTGLFQHALYAVPDPTHGYCIDDNARALLACVRYLHQVGEDPRVSSLMRRYLAFVAYAYNAERGLFRNFMSYDRRWLETRGSEDSQGRTAWALGLTVRDARATDVRDLAGDLFRKALPGLGGLGHIRSWAFALLGLNAYLDYEPGYAPALALRKRFAAALHQAYRARATPDWPWWEDLVTYDNAKLGQALFQTGQALGDNTMCGDAATALRWLIDQQTAVGDNGHTHLSIIGNDGWLKPGVARAVYDQQPLEAWALVEACAVLANGLACDRETASYWRSRAMWCLGWFLGANDAGQPLADLATAGCRDGLQASGPNANQGAESTLSWLLAQLAVQKL